MQLRSERAVIAASGSRRRNALNIRQDVHSTSFPAVQDLFNPSGLTKPSDSTGPPKYKVELHHLPLDI